MPSQPWHWQSCQSCWNRPHGIATSLPENQIRTSAPGTTSTSPVILAGERHIAEIKVREDGNGHWFYDQHLMLEKKEDSPYKPGTSAKDALPFSCGSTSAGESSPTGIIGRRNKEVKRGKRSFATEGKPAGADSAPASPLPSPLAPHLRRCRSSGGRQRQRQPPPRFAGNGLHQGARTVLGVCRGGDRGQNVRNPKSEIRNPSPRPPPLVPRSYLSPLPSSRSTAGRGGGSALARNWRARIAASSIRRRSRGFTVSTALWGPVPSAKVLGTSSGWTWT